MRWAVLLFASAAAGLFTFGLISALRRYMERG
jgi:hypothetical protein